MEVVALPDTVEVPAGEADLLELLELLLLLVIFIQGWLRILSMVGRSSGR